MKNEELGIESFKTRLSILLTFLSKQSVSKKCSEDWLERIDQIRTRRTEKRTKDGAKIEINNNDQRKPFNCSEEGHLPNF